MSRTLSVRARMRVGVAAMVVPLLAVSAAAVVGQEATLDSFAESTDEAMEEALPLARLETLVIQVERNGVLAVLHGDVRGAATYQATRDQMLAAFDALQDTDMTEEGDLASNAETHARRAAGTLDAALASPGSAVGRAAAANRLEEARTDVEAAVTALDAAGALATADIVAEYRSAEQEQRRLLLGIVALVVLGLAIGLGGGLRLTRTVLGPLAAFGAATRRLGDGDLSHRVDLPRGDEFGALARTFNTMAEELQRQQQELARSARHDALTGLPNRLQLAEHLEAALRSGAPTSLLLVDLDGFKSINDTLGHSVGDEVLCGVADRLRRAVRGGDLAVRLGGDEFAVVVAGGEAAGRRTAERVLEAIRPAFPHGDRELFLTASIGVASASGSATGAGDLLRHADLAMYRAKNAGKNDVCVHDAASHDAIEGRMRLATDLPGALERGELVLHYQPVHSIRGGRSVVAVEALMRWQHPTMGQVPPGDFIPLAERSGLIVPIGAWALDEACRQLHEWDDQLGDGSDLQMSVNVSARQLTEGGFPAMVAQTLTRHGVAAGRLVVEITESMLVEDLRSEDGCLTELKRIGVQLAVDDFGTGYSSLSYLPRFPVDQLKIDRSLVEQIDQPRGLAVAAGIIDLARVLGLEPVAEGIEHAHQLDALGALGCTLGQGFHLARPAPAASITRLLTGSAAEGLAAATLA